MKVPWPTEQIEDSLKRLIGSAFNQKPDVPLFSIPRRASDVDGVLWDAFEELKELREENQRMKDAITRALDGCPYCKEDICTADAHRWLYVSMHPECEVDGG